MNIQQNFCNYQISKDLKELGFDEECLAGYFIYTNNPTEFLFPKQTIYGKNYLFRNSIDFTLNENPNAITNSNCCAVLYSQAIQFLREKYNIHIMVQCGHDESKIWYNVYLERIELGYVYKPINDNNDIVADTYNEALVKAIEESIKFVKSKELEINSSKT